MPLFIILLALRSALAQGTGILPPKAPEVAIVGLHIQSMGDEAALALSRSLADALDSSHRLNGVPPSELLPRLKGLQGRLWMDIHMRDGLDALQEARFKLFNLDIKGAEDRASQAVDQLQAALEHVPSSHDLVQALLLLGRLRLFLGDESSAYQMLTRALILDPSLDVDPTGNPTEFVVFFRSTREDLRARGSGTLKLTARDPQVQMYVDGRTSGKHTMILHDLPIGEHSVLAVDASGRRVSRRVMLRSGASVVVSIEPDDFSESMGKTDPRRESLLVRRLYRCLGRYLHSEYVLVGGMTGENTLGLQLYSLNMDAFSKPVFIEVGRRHSRMSGDRALELLDRVTYTGILREDMLGEPLPLDIYANHLMLDMLLNATTR